MADKDKLKKLSTSAEANRKKAEAIIKRRFPNINEKGMEAILRNIGIETSFNSTNGQENPWTSAKIAAADSVRYKTIKSNYQKFLNTKKPVTLLTPGATTTAGPQTQSAAAAGNYTEADYNALSVDEQLSVMYWGNIDEKFAGGLGALQVTSGSNATSVKKYKEMLDATSSSMGITTDDLLVKLKAGDFEAGTEFSLEFYQNHKGTAHNWTAEKLNNTTALGLRTQAHGINPNEDNDILSPLLTDYSHTNSDAAADSLVRRLEWLDEAYYKNGYVVPVSDTNTLEEEKEPSALRKDAINKISEKIDNSDLSQEEKTELKNRYTKKIKDAATSEDVFKLADLPVTQLVKDTDLELRTERAKDLEKQLQNVIDNPEEYTIDQVSKAKELLPEVQRIPKLISLNTVEMPPSSGMDAKADAIIADNFKKRQEYNQLQVDNIYADLEADKDYFDSISAVQRAPLDDSGLSVEDEKAEREQFFEDEFDKIPDPGTEGFDLTEDITGEYQYDEDEEESYEQMGLDPEDAREAFLKHLKKTDKKKWREEKAKDNADRNAKIAKIAGVLGQAGKSAGVALLAGAGLKSMWEATKEHKINKIRISPLMHEAFQKAKTLSTQGMTYEERTAAMSDMNNAYAGAMKNVMAISGGQRSSALANMGVVDASRVNALVDLAGKDAALRQGNMKIYQEQAKNLGQMTLTADSTNEQLRATLEEGRKNRLQKIGDSLFSEATEFSRNLADQRNNKNLLSNYAEMQKQMASSQAEISLIKGMLEDGLTPGAITGDN